MTILDKIVLYKKTEVEEAKKKTPLEELKSKELFKRNPLKLKDFFGPEYTGIIAEFKRASPSKGIINSKNSVEEVTQAYEQAGVSAISVLTDGPSFKGSLDDLLEARKVVNIPLLRKEFIIDTYQIYEAKAYGADLILLIAAILTPKEIKEFSELAQELGLSVLLEVHTEEELTPNIIGSIDAIGVNNRNLHDFSVSIENSLNISPQIPDNFIKISESGISEVSTILNLKNKGFQGFLIGENFMKSSDPMQAIQDFSRKLSS